MHGYIMKYKILRNYRVDQGFSLKNRDFRG